MVRLGKAVLLVFGISVFVTQAAVRNGFDTSDALIPEREILSGGPPRDGIPALTDPVFLPATKASFLRDDDRVLGVTFAGTSRAYPIRILDWHEIVNDRIGAHRFVVTYCPLCGTGVVFEAGNENHNWLEFGVSGLLYNSDVLLYDRATESLWSQLLGRAVSGSLKGTELVQLPARHTTWKDWRSRNPDTQVMSLETGYRRDYDKSPYAGYERSRRLYFGVSHKAPSAYHPKEQVLGIEIDDRYRAYPFVELSRNGKQRFSDELGGVRFQVHWDETARSAWITDDTGSVMATTTGFWFAWFTFHPETEVFESDGQTDS